MIQEVDSSGIQRAQMMPPPRENVQLTDAEKEKLQEIIDKYDPEEMTEESQKEMFEELKSAGIRPGKELKSTLENAGFEMPKPPQGPPPPKMGSGLGVSTQKPEYLQNFENKFQAGEVTDSDIEQLLKNLKSSGESHVGVLLNEQT